MKILNLVLSIFVYFGLFSSISVYFAGFIAKYMVINKERRKSYNF